jgi:hypothetical protein
MNTKMKQIALPLVVVIAVLLAFSSPAAAEGIGGYAGNHPLTIYEHGAIYGGLVYETVTDGSAYKKLQALPEEEDGPLPNLAQEITITIPEGATVKMARLYNYYCWSTSDYDYPDNLGMPAEADMWFNNGTTEVKKVCKHGLLDGLANRNSLANPIDYENGVIQYWDTKGQNYTSKDWDFPSGAFAWDVTDMVTGNGIYTAKIQNNDSSPSSGMPGRPWSVWERIVPFGFGLLVVYEHQDSPIIEYWVAEGCDYLMAQSWETFENATTSATFGDMRCNLADVTDATLIAEVWTHTEGGIEVDWSASQNMMSFNGYEIGPSTAVSDKAIGVNDDDVKPFLRSDENVLEFQDRDDDSCVHNAFFVVECKELPGDTTPPVITCPADVTVEQETRDGTVVPLTATAIDDCDPDPTITSDALAIYPLGTTTVTFTATDASGNSASCTTTVTVIDTTPPEISVTVSPDTLWPPDHKMVDIVATVTVSDICDAAPSVVLTSVTSSEPDNAQGKPWDSQDNTSGDGNTVGDIQGAGIGFEDYEFQLRAERAAKGDGRVYTITYTTTDASGNSASASATVVVPHDMVS